MSGIHLNILDNLREAGYQIIALSGKLKSPDLRELAMEQNPMWIETVRETWQTPDGIAFVVVFCAYESQTEQQYEGMAITLEVKPPRATLADGTPLRWDYDEHIELPDGTPLTRRPLQ